MFFSIGPRNEESKRMFNLNYAMVQFICSTFKSIELEDSQLQTPYN